MTNFKEELSEETVALMFDLLAFLLVTDKMAERKNGKVTIPESLWADNCRARMDEINASLSKKH